MHTPTHTRFAAFCAAAVVTFSLFSQVTGLSRPAAHTGLMAAAPVAGDAQGTVR
ncbi:MAG: hypothetical protein IV093_23175 [Rubrivivax sp.]|nr:hypothetical protein [Rubrivivax sp.]